MKRLRKRRRKANRRKKKKENMGEGKTAAERITVEKRKVAKQEERGGGNIYVGTIRNV